MTGLPPPQSEQVIHPSAFSMAFSLPIFFLSLQSIRGCWGNVLLTDEIKQVDLGLTVQASVFQTTGQKMKGHLLVGYSLTS